MTNQHKITKGDISALIDHLQDGLDDYINNSGGRLYDGDEIMSTWVQRCCVWLNQQIKEGNYA